VKDAWRRHGTSQKREVSREIGAVHEAEHKNLKETFAVRSIDVVIVQERKTKLLSILSQMPAHFQSVIQIRHFDSMSFESIAIILNKSPGCSLANVVSVFETLFGGHAGR